MIESNAEEQLLNNSTINENEGSINLFPFFYEVHRLLIIFFYTQLYKVGVLKPLHL